MKATRALKLLAPWILLRHKKLRPREKGTCCRRRRPPGCRIRCRRPHHSLNICRRSLAEEQERGVLDFNIPLWPQIESMPRIPRRQRAPSRPIISSGAAINPATDRMHSHSNLAARRPRPGHYLLLGALTPQPPSERATGAISRFHAAPPRISMHTKKELSVCCATAQHTRSLRRGRGFQRAAAADVKVQGSSSRPRPYHQARSCSGAQDEKLRPFCFCSSRNKLGAWRLPLSRAVNSTYALLWRSGKRVQSRGSCHTNGKIELLERFF